MYGTVARLQLKPGGGEKLNEIGDSVAPPPGFIASYALRMDDNPNDAYLVTIFESKDAYHTNAQAPEQHAIFEQMVQQMTAEPEWHDGEVVYQMVGESGASLERDRAYGTVARLRVKPGGVEKLNEIGAQTPPPKGSLAAYAFRMDEDPQETWMLSVFESKEAYRANAESTEQHERFTQMMQYLDGEPEWHDGHVAYHKKA